MPIRPKSAVVVAPRARTRPPVDLIEPNNPEPTMATWAIDIEVKDALKMYHRAVHVMRGAAATPKQINERLTKVVGDNHYVDVAECLKVLFDFTLRSVEELTECKVHDPCLYLEPLARDGA